MSVLANFFLTVLLLSVLIMMLLIIYLWRNERWKILGFYKTLSILILSWVGTLIGVFYFGQLATNVYCVAIEGPDWAVNYGDSIPCDIIFFQLYPIVLSILFPTIASLIWRNSIKKAGKAKNGGET